MFVTCPSCQKEIYRPTKRKAHDSLAKHRRHVHVKKRGV